MQVNVANIKELIPEFFSENLVRGKGLLARSIITAQQQSPTFTPVYAALLSIINTKVWAYVSMCSAMIVSPLAIYGGVVVSN